MSPRRTGGRVLISFQGRTLPALSALMVGLMVFSVVPVRAHAQQPPPAEAPPPASTTVAPPPPAPLPPETSPFPLAPPPDPAQLNPNWVPPPRPRIVRGNPAMVRAGTVLFAVGVATFGAGIVTYTSAVTATDSVRRVDLATAAYALYGAGAGLIAVGLPIWLVGARQTRRVAQGWSQPTLLVGARSVGVRWTF
ncbi:MAG TPA: hypothetical protein VH877_34190 [Polyangia bacterium]|nr:hypothetical protein [Polyangia bacterium]